MNELRKILRSFFSLESGSDTPESIREKVVSGAQVRGTNMCILVLAIFIASIGLNMNSTAVIIGAMLISPLMGGIMAIGYGIAVNDLPLTRKAFLGLMFQVALCIVTSMLYFSLSPISVAHSELLARTNPTIWDVMIAIFGGLAGIIGVTREEKTNVLPGVAIATALMPPLCTAGYGLAMRSVHFFLGAMYLFFINSFFICVSTVVIVRVMHLPRKKFIDRQARLRVKTAIWVIAVITVLPSIYLGWQIVNESVLDNNVERFLSEEFNFSDTQVVRSYTDKDAGELRVALLGKRLSDERVETLRDAMKLYHLDTLQLKVTQTELEEGMAVEEIQQLIEKELDETVKQTSVLAQSKKLDDLEAELVKYKALLLEYQSYDYDVQALLPELRSLAPQVSGCSVGRHKYVSDGAPQAESGVVVTVDLSERLSPELAERLVSWLSVKLGASPVTLYQNMTAAPGEAPEEEGGESEETVVPTWREENN